MGAAVLVHVAYVVGLQTNDVRRNWKGLKFSRLSWSLKYWLLNQYQVSIICKTNRIPDVKSLYIFSLLIFSGKKWRKNFFFRSILTIFSICYCCNFMMICCHKTKLHTQVIASTKLSNLINHQIFPSFKTDIFSLLKPHFSFLKNSRLLFNVVLVRLNRPRLVHSLNQILWPDFEHWSCENQGIIYYKVKEYSFFIDGNYICFIVFGSPLGFVKT